MHAGSALFILNVDLAIQASYFCYPCTLAQMETEIKDRAALLKHSSGKAEGYSQQPGGMAYQNGSH